MKGARSRLGRDVASRSIGGADLGDSESITTVSGGTVQLGQAYLSRVRSSGGGTNDVVQLPAPQVLGQRKVVLFATEAAAGDTVRVNAASGDQIVREGFSIVGVTNYTEVVVANVDLLSGNAQALFEYRGVSGTSTDTWHLLYITPNVTAT